MADGFNMYPSTAGIDTKPNMMAAGWHHQPHHQTAKMHNGAGRLSFQPSNLRPFYPSKETHQQRTENLQSILVTR